MTKPIPFAIDRNNRVNLPEQLVRGFRAAIRSGYYKPGERLPSFSEIVRALDVSIRAPREAMKILAGENLVRARPRLGCEVLARGERLWKGRVLAVLMSAHEGSYYISTLVGSIRKTVVAAGYLFVPVTIDRKRGGGLDFSQFDAQMKEPVDFVIGIYPDGRISRRLAKCGVPALAYLDVQRDCGIPSVRLFAERHLAAIADKVKAAGVKSVLTVEYAEMPQVSDVLRRKGFAVERLVVRPKEGPGYLEDIERKAMSALAARLAAKGPRPELVAFTDDYVAFGGLMAIAASGLRVPQDLKILTMANRGFSPVFPVPLARVEVDPYANGAAIGRVVLARLSGEPDPTDLPHPEFRPGASLPISLEAIQLPLD